MNVNPFSYLIEKLKGKVDKSGDTMTGNLIISRNATTSELELGNSTTSKGLIILFSNNDKYEVLRSPDGMAANRNIYLPDASGTVALTSDIDKGSVSVTSNGSKTFAQLFNELFALVDTSKIRKTAYIVYALDANRFNIYRFSEKSTTHHVFTYTTMTNEPKSNIWSIYLSSASKYYYADGNSYGEASSNTVPNGRSFTLYY